MTKHYGEHFTIYTFMPRILGLGGGELLVYALIYSFSSKGEEFYGSVSYIAERTGLSVSSVKRALKSLSAMNYIIRESVTDRGTVKYCANMAIVKENIHDTDCNEIKSPDGTWEREGQNDTSRGAAHNEPPPSSKRTGRSVKMSYNNKEIINNTSTTSSYTEGNLKSSIRRHGFENLVMLSDSQIAELHRRYGEDVTNEYIIKLESYLVSFPSSYLKNHYKTIISWIEEDFRA